MKLILQKTAPPLAFALTSVSLFAAVLLRGGVYPEQWKWTALGVSVAALLITKAAPVNDSSTRTDWAQWLLVALLVWMASQLVPLPPALVAFLSPERSNAVSAARELIGQNARTWFALSVAPGETLDRLLDVVPAMAAFLVARTLCVYWRSKPWLLAIPVIAIAWLESVLGLLQFYARRRGSGVAGLAGLSNVVTGTYANRNHFAGLLEMAFPLAVLCAVASWRKRRPAATQAGSLKPALAAIGLLSVAACLLVGISLSLSRMAFIATLAAATLTALILLAPHQGHPAPIRRWRWLASPALLVLLLVSLPSRELLNRFAQVSRLNEIPSDARLGIWRDTMPLIAAYKWAGCGLGAYEQCFYRFNTRSPMETINFAHNDYLQIIAELGFAGAALAAALALWIAWRLLSVVLRMPASRNWELAVGLLGALFAIALHSLVDFNLYIPANALTLAWLSGIAASPALRDR